MKLFHRHCWVVVSTRVEPPGREFHVHAKQHVLDTPNIIHQLRDHAREHTIVRYRCHDCPAEKVERL